MSGAVMPFTFADRWSTWPRKTFAALLFSAAILLTASEPAEARRYASIVVDAVTGEVLHADKADRRAYPASLTKMMTLYLLFEALDQGRLSLDQKLPVSRRAAGMPPSKLGLKRGQSIRVKHAIKALVTKSANDVAVVVAEALGGSEQKFARLMTEKARKLGMSRTTFRNASGLPNNQQLSTARDMSRLAQALQRHFPHHYRVFSTKSFSYNGRRYKNHNKLLSNYGGTDGVKTGYTHASGFNLAASTVRDGRRLIAVVFGGKTAKSRDRHIRKLLDRSFAKLAKRGVPLISRLPIRKPRQGGAPLVAQADQPQVPDNSDLERVIEQVASKGRNAAQTTLPVTPVPKPALNDPKATVRATSAAREKAKPVPAEPKPAAKAAAKVETTAKAPDPNPAAQTSVQVTPTPRPPDNRSTGTVGASKIASLSRLAALSQEVQGSTEGLPRGVGRLGTLRVVRQPDAGDPAAVAWGVQVGAFTRYETAQHAASKAISKMPTFLRSSQVMISSSPGVSGTIFRARVVGMTESSARLACGALKAKSMNCVVVRPGQG